MQNLWLLFVLACPLMMIFMMRGMGGGGGHGGHMGAPPENKGHDTTAERDRRIAELERENAALRQMSGHQGEPAGRPAVGQENVGHDLRGRPR